MLFLCAVKGHTRDLDPLPDTPTPPKTKPSCGFNECVFGARGDLLVPARAEAAASSLTHNEGDERRESADGADNGQLSDWARAADGTVHAAAEADAFAEALSGPMPLLPLG